MKGVGGDPAQSSYRAEPVESLQPPASEFPGSPAPPDLGGKRVGRCSLRVEETTPLSAPLPGGWRANRAGWRCSWGLLLSSVSEAADSLL